MPEATRLPVSETDRRELQSWLRAGTTRKSHAERARIILLSAEGLSAEAISAQLGVVRLTVYKWRSRYRSQGVAGLEDLPRPGQPRKMTSEKARQILDWTTHRVPRESTHWSLALMAKYAGVTRWQVEQVWKAADLRPHRIKSFKISNDPRFSEKVIDVVGLYLNPPDNAVVLSVDEKTQILDNSGTHKTPDVNRWLEAHPRFKLHFTPTSYIDAHNLASAKPFGNYPD